MLFVGFCFVGVAQSLLDLLALPAKEILFTVLAAAAMTFVAILLLLARDGARTRSTIKRIQERLKDRPELSDESLASEFPLDREKSIAIDFRKGLANCLDVDHRKIYPDDNLYDDYKIDAVSEILLPAIALEIIGEYKASEDNGHFEHHESQKLFREIVRLISQQSH